MLRPSACCCLETFVDPQRFHGTRLSRGQLVVSGADPQAIGAPARATAANRNRPKRCSSSLCKPMHARCLPVPSCPTLSSRRPQDHAERRTDAIVARLFHRHSRSAPRPGTAPPLAHRIGHRSPRRSCAACAVTRRSPTGHKVSAPKPRERFAAGGWTERYLVPSESIIRDVLIRVAPADLDRALQRWNQTYGQHDETLAIDGKTMCNAIDDRRPSNPCHERRRPSAPRSATPKKSRRIAA